MLKDTGYNYKMQDTECQIKKSTSSMAKQIKMANSKKQRKKGKS